MIENYKSNMIIFFSAKPYDIDFFTKENKNYGYKLQFLELQLNEVTVNVIDEADGHKVVCPFVNDILNRNVIEKLAQKGVKQIAMRCAGFNNVDLDAAKEFGLVVTRVPAYSPECVAEMAMALILTLNRKTHRAYNRIRDQNFTLNGLLGFNLYGKTIGVVGTGKIGKCFIRIARGFGAKVVCYDVYQDANLQKETDDSVQYVSLEELYKESTIISLHVPLTKDNHHMINSEALAQMKDGVMIINTSRGALISTKDVISGLKSGKIGYLGLDVYEHEENCFFKDLTGTIIEDDQIQRLVSFPNVLITAHQAFFTEEALTQISAVTMNNIHTVDTTGEPQKGFGL